MVDLDIYEDINGCYSLYEVYVPIEAYETVNQKLCSFISKNNTISICQEFYYR